MNDHTNILEVYLEEDHFNPVCNARIPGAWVAVIENDYLGQIKQPFACPGEYANAEQAMIGAEAHFNS